MKCVCLARGGVRGKGGGGEWIRGLGLGFTNPVGTGGLCLGYGGVWGVDRGLGPWSGRAGWCYVCVSCESGLFV